MTIEKCVTTASKPAVGPKEPAASKAGKGASVTGLAGEKNSAPDDFSALLANLGADDLGEPEITVVVAPVEVPVTETPPDSTDPQVAAAALLLVQQNWNTGNNVAAVDNATVEKATFSDARGEGVLTDAFDLSANPLATLDTRGLAPARPKVAGADSANVLADPAQGVQTRGLMASPAKSLKDKLLAAAANNVSSLDKSSVSATGVNPIDRNKLMADLTSKLEVLRPTGLQAGGELSLNSVGDLLETRREKVIFKSSATYTNTASGNGADLRQPSLNGDVSAPDGAAATAAVEQTPGTYWLSGDMKNAEMTLDGVGEGSVEVSISLHGKQTHVSFRTDEDQTRAALESAGLTLRDMLHREGLELSGVSVGLAGSHLGQGAGDEQTPRQRSDYRAFKMETTNGEVSSDRVRPVSGRQSGGLDIFV